jgi:phytanoyl-CoA hydroxylase
MAETWRLEARERDQLGQEGFVVRRNVFDASEIGLLGDACEALVTRLLEEQRNVKVTVGSYTFEIQQRLGTVVKWEQENPDLLLGIELFAHLSETLREWALDPRLLGPARDLVGSDDIDLFTEKLNLKRAHRGGPIVLHQDFPYWADATPIAARVATAVIFVDEARCDNGCLEVVPGSHRDGVQARKAVDGFGSLEMDPAAFDTSRLVPLEVAAGGVVFFGPFLVHRSLPNRSGHDRRALLFSYQPLGHPHLRQLLKFGPSAGRTEPPEDGSSPPRYK